MIRENYKSSEKIKNEIIPTNPNNITTNIEINLKNDSIIEKSKHKKEKTKIKKTIYNKCKLLLLLLGILSIIFFILIIILLIIILKSKNCENGYFHPNNEKTLCYKCEIYNCEKCSGTIKNQVCNSCKENFELKNGRCLSLKEIDPSDKISDIILNESDIISNESDILSISNETNIISISEESDIISIIENSETISIFEENDTIKILNSSDIVLISEEIDTISIYEKSDIIPKSYENNNCNPGYFLPDDETIEYKCHKCSIDNCEVCHGTKINNICITCKNTYNLIDGKCIKISVVEAIYKFKTENITIQLINKIENIDIA